MTSKEKPPTKGRRFLKLAGMTASVARDYAWSRARTAFLSTEEAELAQMEAHRRAGERVARTLGELKGAVMKVGQMASLASDLLPPGLAAALGTLQKQAPPMAFEVIADQIETEFGCPVEQLFESFERAPFASASIGQVHRARTDDGREVVCKVQYPGVDSAVDSDLAHLKFALRAGGFVIDRRALDETFGEIRARLEEELDYCLEADHARRFREYHALHHPQVVIPDVVGERSAKRVLTLTYEGGDSPEEVVRLGYTQAERDACAVNLWTAMQSQIFDFCNVHADPNAANFAFRRDGTVVMYDFGCVKRLPQATMATYREMILQGVSGNYTLFEDSLQTLGVRAPGSAQVPHEVYEVWRKWLTEPLRHGQRFDFATSAHQTEFRRVISCSIKHASSFQPSGDLVFLHRVIVGHFLNVCAMRAGMPLLTMLDEHITGVEEAVREEPTDADDLRG